MLPFPLPRIPESVRLRAELHAAFLRLGSADPVRATINRIVERNTDTVDGRIRCDLAAVASEFERAFGFSAGAVLPRRWDGFSNEGFELFATEAEAGAAGPELAFKGCPDLYTGRPHPNVMSEIRGPVLDVLERGAEVLLRGGGVMRLRRWEPVPELGRCECECRECGVQAPG